MNLKLFIICTAIVLSLMSLADADSTATIHGAVYKMDTFEPLDNAVIEVNSTPTQYMVAKNGHYSVELLPGNYTITARYYEDNTLIYAAVATINIETGGDYVYDLLLNRVSSENTQESPNEQISSNEQINISIEKLNNSSGLNNVQTNSENMVPKEENLFQNWLIIGLIFAFIGGIILNWIIGKK